MDSRKRRRLKIDIAPAVARERSRKAGLARTTNAYFIKKLTENARALTVEQREQLAALATGEPAA
jgi:hypothetical protein